MDVFYDCFLINTEIDDALVRMETLYPYVKKFVVVEGAYELETSIPKATHFADNRDRFEKYADKISYYCNDTPNTTIFYQRDMLMKGLEECKSSDLVIYGNVMELPKPEFLPQAARVARIMPVALVFHGECFFPDGSVHPTQKVGATVTTYDYLSKQSLNELRRERVGLMRMYGSGTLTRRVKAM